MTSVGLAIGRSTVVTSVGLATGRSAVATSVGLTTLVGLPSRPPFASDMTGATTLPSCVSDEDLDASKLGPHVWGEPVW
jgi:hypothetical protein